jgi:MFS family permease
VTSGITPNRLAPRSENGSVERRPLAAIAVLIGGLLALVLAPGLVTLLRERLHYLCGTDVSAPERMDWTCADGISYLGAGLLPLAVAALVVLAALILVLAARVPIRLPLGVLAVVAVVVGLAGTWHAVTAGSYGVPPGILRSDFWIEAVLPAALAVAVSVVLMIVGVVLRGWSSVVVTSAAALGIAVATVLQPGLALSTMPALGILAASAVSTPRAEGREGAFRSPRDAARPSRRTR